MKSRTLLLGAIAVISSIFLGKVVSQLATAHAPELHQNQQNRTPNSPTPSPSKPSPTPNPTCQQPPCGTVSPSPSNQKTQKESQDTSQEPSTAPLTESQPTSNQQIARSPTAGWGEAILAAIVGTPMLLYWLKYRLY